MAKVSVIRTRHLPDLLAAVIAPLNARDADAAAERFRDVLQIVLIGEGMPIAEATEWVDGCMSATVDRVVALQED